MGNTSLGVDHSNPIQLRYLRTIKVTKLIEKLLTQLNLHQHLYSVS